MKPRFFFAAAFFAASFAHAAMAGTMPNFSVQNLNGKSLSVPADLPSERTVVLLGFKHADKTALDAWVAGLGLADNGPWVEMPLIGVSNGMIKGMITSGMKGGVKSADRRDRMAPVFGDHAAMVKSLGVAEGVIQALVIDRSGNVLAEASGPYDSAKGAAILGALK